jgi:hypothetical protein
MAIYLFNKPGFDTDWANAHSKLQIIKQSLSSLSSKLSECSAPEEMENILQLEVLEERIAKHRVAASQVGRFEREYFEKAFLVLFEEVLNIVNFEPCWVAY